MSEKKGIIKFIIRIIQGILMGSGAILPGVSGGVLSVTFGVYRPLMELLSGPVKALGKYYRMYIPCGIGWLIGFLGGANLISFMFAENETVAVSLFVGMIAGSLPKLWKEAGEQGRNKQDYAAFLLSFVLLLAFLVYVQYGPVPSVEPGLPGFILCGLLWGLSTVIPGMTTASLIIAMGLYVPMTDGIAALDMVVIAPWSITMLVVALVFARGATRLYERHFSVASHIVFGVVLASTVAIIPLEYNSSGEALAAFFSALAGGLVIFWFDRYSEKVLSDESK